MDRKYFVLLAFSLTTSVLYAQPARRTEAVDEIAVVRAPVEKLTLHVPASKRTEADEDRIYAAALFAEGRLFFQREQFERALVKYERAHRYSRAKTSICEEIIPLAYRIGRYDEAFRYLDQASEEINVDPFVIRRLAITFTEQGQLANAAQLYQRILNYAPLDDRSDNQSNNIRFITQFELGRIYFLLERYSDAANFFLPVSEALDAPEDFQIDKETVTTVLDKPEITYSVFAETFLSANKLDKAAHYFRRTSEHSGNKSVLHYELARVAEAAKDFAAAEQHLNQYFQSNATDAGAQPYFLLHRIYSATLDNATIAQDKFINRLTALSQKEDYDISIGYVLAEHLVNARKLEEATALYTELVKREPLLEAFIGFNRIAWLERQPLPFLTSASQIVGATGAFDTIEPTLQQAGGSPEFSGKVLDLALHANDNKSMATILVAAKLAIHAQQFEAANKLFENAVSRSQPAGADISLMWANAMIESNQLDTAASILQNAIESEKDANRNAEWHFYLSGVLAAQDRKELAMESAAKCGELGDGSPHLELHEAWILYVCDELESSRNKYQRFLKKWSENHLSPQIRNMVKEANSTLSAINAELGQWAEAMEPLERVLDEFPNDIGAMNDLGYLWADRNIHLQRAYQMVHAAVIAEPQNAAYRDSLGWALHRLGRHGQAVTELRTAVALETPDPLILDHLGEALFADDKKTEAVAIWNQAINMVAPGSPLHARIASKLKQLSE